MYRIHLNEKHKKWALTTTLLAVLGFNLSAPFQSSISSLDLASKTPVDVCKGSKKKQKTIIQKDGKDYVVELECIDGKTVASVPVALEGGSCESSGRCFSTVVLKDGLSDLKDIKIAILESIVAKSELPPKPRGTPANKERPEERKEEVADRPSREEAKLEKDKAALERVKRSCRTEDEGERKANCLKRAFISLLKDRTGDRQIDKSLAADFFKEEIKTEVSTMLKTMDSYTHERIADMIKDFLGRLPKGYNDVRKAANDLNADVLRAFAAQVAKTKSQADNYKNQANVLKQQAQQMQRTDPQYALQAMQQAMQAQQIASQLDGQFQLQKSQIRQVLFPTLYGYTQDGLTTAVNDKLIDLNFGQSLLNDFYSNARVVDNTINAPLNSGIFTLPDGTTVINGTGGRALVPNFTDRTGQGGSITVIRPNNGVTNFGSGNSPIRQQPQPFQNRF
jgi:hypothetical protein